MLEVMSTTPALVGLRTRRGIAIAAVTLASLGVGGLVAAGPGFFQAAADKVFTNDEEMTEAPEDDGDEQSETNPPSDELSSNELSSDPSGTDVAKLGDEVECAEGNHGKTVSSIAQATESSDDKGEIVKAAAQSDCGKRADDEEIPADDIENDVVCAEGNHGQTVTSVAEATESGPGKGQIVSAAAQSDCGKNVDDEADGGNGNGQPEEPGKPNVTTPADTRPTPTPPTDPGKPNDPGQPTGAGNVNGGGNPND